MLTERMVNNRAFEALDWQVDLISWWRSTVGVQFGAAFAADETAKTGVLSKMGTYLSSLLGSNLDQAETYWVNEDMGDMVVAIAREDALPNTIERHDVPSERGFVVFERPIEYIDIQDNLVCFRAIQWGPGDVVNEIAEGVIELEGRDHAPGMFVAAYTDTVASRNDDDNVRDAVEKGIKLPRFWLLTVSGLRFGEQPPIPADAELHGPHSVMIAHAFWLLSQQRIALRSGADIPRPTRRRLERFGSLAMVPEVIVVTLRRGYEKIAERLEEDDGTMVLWSHRWRVHGHWRKQPIGERGSGQWKHTWIDDYVKGPEHLPFIEKDMVAKLVR